MTKKTDEIITIRRSDLAAAMVTELLDFFDDPRASGPTLHEAEACWLVAGGIRRALREAGNFPLLEPFHSSEDALEGVKKYEASEK